MVKNLGYLIAFPFIVNDNLGAYVECGKSLLENGFSSGSVRSLAGLGEPLLYAGIREYILDAKRDLALADTSEDEAVSAFAYATVEGIANKIDVMESVKRLYTLCMQHEFNPGLYDFYLLQCAMDALAYEDLEQTYWEGLTLANSADVICAYAGSWLEKNKLRMPSGARSAIPEEMVLPDYME